MREIMPALKAAAKDKVPNVRFAVAKALGEVAAALDASAVDGEVDRPWWISRRMKTPTSDFTRGCPRRCATQRRDRRAARVENGQKRKTTLRLAEGARRVACCKTSGSFTGVASP